MVVATGDSVTSAHIQNVFHLPPKDCAGNTRQDDRKPPMPGNDMMSSYVGRYATALNQNVVEYYNFARTGFGTPDIINMPNHPDSCNNPWDRVASPLGLADRAISQAKAEKKAAYFVSTGGVNNTNWTDVLTAIAECGLMDYYASKVQNPWKGEVDWFDVNGNPTTKGAVIDGGSCHLKVTGKITGADYVHARIPIPGYDGRFRLNQVQQDVTAIVNSVIAAGADKVVWMGYYDITPARLDVGLFAETYRLKLSDKLRGLLPGQFGSDPRFLIDDDWWQGAVQQWTADMNDAIWRGLPNRAGVTFQPAPRLPTAQIQQTGLGGCPHPNLAGHGVLADALKNAFGD
ncbi:hypothetical protein ACFFWC_13795 [Plantactinospora siamensis]|uniref:SGNH hydrolase-type esterase domain-containing protein n=1 Tax=Plantactinospora siamensis TaxID=555372 RepID=A0ABV6P2Q8_9ACTN